MNGYERWYAIRSPILQEKGRLKCGFWRFETDYQNIIVNRINGLEIVQERLKRVDNTDALDCASSVQKRAYDIIERFSAKGASTTFARNDQH